MSENCPVCGGPLAASDTTCPTCGFKLLDSTRGFKPITFSDEDTTTTPIPEEAIPVKKTASLRIVRGPQIEMLFELGDKPSVIGRSPQCDVFLNDMTVSREHAIINPCDQGFIISDTNSYNGIWINNENVSNALLKDGDIVQVGTFCLLFEE